MNVNKNHCQLLIAALATAGLAFGGDEISSARFPDADTVTVDERERVTYRPDGSYVSEAECWTKILTEKGRRAERTQSIHYSRRYGEASFLSVGIIGTNGVERAVDLAATTKESTDNGGMSVNIYDPLDRRIVCTIPGLSVGETLHVRTRRAETKPRCVGKWSDLSVMEGTAPVLRSSYEVVSPKELPIRRVAVRHPLGNIVSNVTHRADGSLVYSFVATNSPQAFPEPDMPPFYTQSQNVRLSTAADWPEISRWYWSICEPHLAKTNAALVAKSRELKSVEAIFKFVSQEIRYMGLTMEDTSPGYAPHDVSITFDNRYGVCRDKAGLLVAMLRAAGHEAYPVLINVGAKLDPDVPQPFFNHAVVAVDEGNRRYRLMDPTNENAKDLFPSYESDKSYIVCRPDGENLMTSPVPDPAKNALAVKTSGALAKDGSLFLESEISFGGINDTAYRGIFARRTPDEREKTFARLVKGLAAGAELVRCELEPRDMRDTSRPLVARLSVKYPESVLRGETESELSMPFVSRRLGVANFLLLGNTSLEKRRYPLVLDSTAQVCERVKISLGEGLGAAKTLPSAGEKGNGHDYSCRYAIDDGCLVADRVHKVAAVEFSPSDYAALRDGLKRVEAAERRKCVFAVDPFADADVDLLLNSVETTVLSEREWITTNRVEKRILTYNGKKRSSELSFGFNPCVETVELISAVVSNGDGRVASVSEREKNVMDCGWAAAARRYPASRTLIVNLPSVEIGSVISYAVVRHVTNAPASFYANYCFDSTEPVGRLSVRVNDWRREVVRPRRLPKEPSQPAATLWRDVVTVSSNRFDRIDLKIGRIDAESAPKCDTLRGIRDWMAKNVKVAGPSLWELPLDLQLTDPEVVLRERYATRLDYIRTLASLLRGADFDADVVLVNSNAGEPEALRLRDRCEHPNVRAFSVPLCRVRLASGGFLGFGATERVVFIGTENEYSPIGPSAYAGSDYFDPEDCSFGTVTVPEADFAEFSREKSMWLVRENGGVDLTVEDETFGPAVGAFRRKYAEILPEERDRLHQSILGAVAQAATATSDLEADTEGYPARRKFSCYVPDYATVANGSVSLQLPSFANSVPSIAGKARRTPVSLSECDDEVDEAVVVFPDGYTKVEHLPEPFVFTDPTDPTRVWMKNEVESRLVGDHLEVTLRRTVCRRVSTLLAADFFELVNDRARIAASRANRTLVVRKRQ